METKGVYVSRGLYPDGSKALLEWAKSLGIPNLYSEDMLHCTVLYSRENIQHRLSGESTVVTPCGLTILGTSLVLMVISTELQERHLDLLSEGGTTDFPDYLPHITIGELKKDYDYTPFLGKCPKFDLTLAEEVLEDLDLNWKQTNNITSSASTYSILIFDKSCLELVGTFLLEMRSLGAVLEGPNVLRVPWSLDVSSVITVDGVSYYSDKVDNMYYISAFPFPINR
ncbi:MAG: hypothetical protein EOM67_15880 [Spirochaetia bacterium]|nr:hypothetical protein [Spirochaetia bacterium]